MTKEFDPYYEWLGIPPKDQPPNHYRLLGIELFEASRSVIDTAANRQMSFLKEYQAGEHSELTQRLLNELATARLCLLNSEKKAAYDEELRAVLRARESPARPRPLGHGRQFDGALEEATGTREHERLVVLSVPMTPPTVSEPVLPQKIEDSPPPTHWQGSALPPIPVLATELSPDAVEPAEPVEQSRRQGAVLGLAIGFGSIAIIVLVCLWASSVIGPSRSPDRGASEVAQIRGAPSPGSTAKSPQDTEPRWPAAFLESADGKRADAADASRGAQAASSTPPTDAAMESRDGSVTGMMPSELPTPGGILSSGARVPAAPNPLAPSMRQPVPTSGLPALDQSPSAKSRQATSPPFARGPDKAQTPASLPGTSPQGGPAASGVTETTEQAEQRLTAEMARASSAPARQLVAEQALRATDQAIVDGQHDAAKRLATLAFAAAGKSGAAQPAKDAALRLIEFDRPISDADREFARQRLGQSRESPAVAAALTQANGDTAQSRAPVPNFDARDASKKSAAEIYAGRFQQAKTGADKAALAGEMVEAALKVRDGSPDQYALLKIAGDVAAGAGDAVTALQTVEKLGERFDVPVPTLQAETLLTAAREATMTSQRKAVAEAAVSVIENLEKVGDYEGAISVCEAARSSAHRARENALLREFVAKATELKRQQQESQGYREALTVMESSPTDPAANLAAGRYLCLVKGDWERGMPMLALGGDPELKTVAIKDLRGADSADEKASLADGWWGLAEKETETARDRMRERAAQWYQQALPNLVGLTRVKAEDRLAVALYGGVKTNKAITKVQDGRVGTYRASPSDLVNRGQPSFASIAIVDGQAIGESRVSSLNDGELYDKRGAVDIGATLHPTDGTTVLFTLNTNLAPKGYDLAAIASTTASGGPGQPRSRQNYTVEVAGAGSTKFLPVVNVENLGSKVDEVQVITTGENNRPLAHGVERVRVTFHNTDCECRESMYREFDIIGTRTP